MSSPSSSDDERMVLQIKPPPPVLTSESKSRSKSEGRERRRALASRLGPRDPAYNSGSGSGSQGHYERSSMSSKINRQNNPGIGDRRDRIRYHRDYMQSQPYDDQQRERIHHMIPGGSNWDRNRVPRNYIRDYERSQERPLKRSVRDRLGPVEPDMRAGRYWEEKSMVASSSTITSISKVMSSQEHMIETRGDPHRDNRSKELMKHKQKRKHLEQEQERAFREIEKRRQRERREEERRAPKERNKRGHGELRHTHEHEEDLEEEEEGINLEKVPIINLEDESQGIRTTSQEGDDVELIEVEDLEVSLSSAEEGEEELEEGALPSNSDLSGNSGNEDENGRNRKSRSTNKHEKEIRRRNSTHASTQNSDISSDEERHEGNESQPETSSSKSSTESNSESSTDESKSSADDQEREQSGSPKAKRGRNKKKSMKLHPHHSSSSSSKRKSKENGSGKGLLSERSDSDEESYRGDDDEKNSDIEMVDSVNKEKETPPIKIPEVKIVVELTDVEKKKLEVDLLPPYFPAIQGCRRVEEFTLLNRIEEGTYGVVYRAKDKRTNEIVALKRLKMEKEKDGFPITSLREINTLLKAQHENIVTVREIVVGSNTDKIFLVMDYVEHDLKALMETLKQKEQAFILVEIKCLMQQLLRAVAHLHDNWILHRDLKASNILLSHKGILKVGDFGLAREYGSPLKSYTPIVVTLWYRAPELLLQTKEYSTPIDMWSVGCIFGELLKMEPMFPGKSEANQLNLIFSTLGTPNDKIWPGYSKLPLLQKLTFTENPVNKLKSRFGMLSELGIDLLNKLLTYNPAKRINAEDALQHEFFKERPLPIDPSVFSTWPAKSEMGHRKSVASPKPPSGGRQFKDLREEDGEGAGFFLGLGDRRPPIGAGFNLKF